MSDTVVDDPYIVLGGHSAGGGLVLAFANSIHRHLACSYLFLAPFLGLGSEVNRPHFGGWVRVHRLKLAAIALAKLAGLSRFDDATVVTFNTAPARDERYVASWSFMTLLAFGPGPWLPGRLSISPEQRVLVLALQDDECFKQPLFAAAFAAIAPHAEVPELGRGGHWDLLVDQGAIQRLIAWLHAQASREETEPKVALPGQAA